MQPTSAQEDAFLAYIARITIIVPHNNEKRKETHQEMERTISALHDKVKLLAAGRMSEEDFMPYWDSSVLMVDEHLFGPPPPPLRQEEKEKEEKEEDTNKKKTKKKKKKN